MSLFKKRKESAPATPQFADEDPNSPLRKLPLDAQKEFLASSLTKDEVLKDWDVFMQCIYFQCRTAFEKAPPEVLKKRSQLQAESAAAATSAATPQRTLDPSNRPSLTRKRSGTCPAIFPSESDKAGLEGNATNAEDRKENDEEQNSLTKPKRDRSSSEKDAASDLKAADRKRAKSSAKAAREGKEVNAEDAELKKVTRNKRSVSALKERDVKNREDMIKIEIVDSVAKSSSDGKIKNEKKPDPAVDSIKMDDSSRKDSSSQLELKASTSSEKAHSGSEEKKKDESNKPVSLIASNSSVETAGETIANAAAPTANEDKGTANNTPKEGSPRESPKGDKTASVGSDQPVRTSSSEKIKDKSKRKRSSKNMEVDIITDKVLVIEDPKNGSKSTPSSPAPEKKHKKRSISNSSKKDKDKEKARSKTPDRERLGDDQKSKLTAIPETSPLDSKAEKAKEEKSRRKSEGQVPNKVEKAPTTLVNGEPVDTTKSQNEANTGVLSNNSNSKTTSVGTSTGTGKKKRSTSITLTEEELNQIFIKANPKDFYSISHKIGKGAFATVHIGKSLNKAEKNKRVAIKVATLNSDKDKEKDPKKKSKANINLIANEIRLLNSCQHPNIVKHLGSYTYKEQIWTVMEYCDGGTLKDLLRVQLNENHIAFVLRDIISAVNYLHERKRIHRDLKSDNILLNVNADVKIADLGLSVELDEADDDSEFGIAGSRFWLAPEMIRGDGYGVKADIWSLGCVAIEMADGRPPNYSFHPLKAIFYTATKGFTGLRQPEKWSSNFRDFLGRCFEFDPSKRATAAELSQHPFLKSASSRREMAEMLKMAFMLKVTEGLEY